MTKERNDWIKKAFNCKRSRTKAHDWMALAKSRTQSSELVTELICKSCFEIVSMGEVTRQKALERLDEMSNLEETPDSYEELQPF